MSGYDPVTARRMALMIRPEYDDDLNAVRARQGRRRCECRTPLMDSRDVSEDEPTCQMCGKPSGRGGRLAA